MKSQGDVIRGHGVLPFHGLWETAKEWVKRQSPRDTILIVVFTIAALVIVGLVVYGFCEALQTLKMGHLSPYWTMTYY